MNAGRPKDAAGIAVRPAAPGDIPAVAALERELFSDPWTEESLADCLRLTYRELTVCEEEGRIVGYLVSQHAAGEAELLRIGVAEDRRQNGIGTRLIGALFRHCGERETPRIFLEVRVSNAAAIGLYERLGFRRTGIRRKYYRGPEEDACLMEGEAAPPRETAETESAASQ